MKRALILSGGGSRGSFQVGVWKYLQEIGWQPDLICGSSIGAINAAAICSNLTVEQIASIWTTSGRKKIYKLQLINFILNNFFKKRLVPLMDTAPLKSLLQSCIDFKQLKESSMDIIISAVNLHTAMPEFFNKKQITIDHLMASSAMPIIFPYYVVNNVPYWDGGIMMNTPLLPALAAGMDEIVVVLLSPVGHVLHLSVPEDIMCAGEYLMEQSLIASYQSTVMHSQAYRNMPESHYKKNFSEDDKEPETPRIITIAPSKMLGIRSLLNFTLKQANTLMAEGYDSAKRQLENIF